MLGIATMILEVVLTALLYLQILQTKHNVFWIASHCIEILFECLP